MPRLMVSGSVLTTVAVRTDVTSTTSNLRSPVWSMTVIFAFSGRLDRMSAVAGSKLE